jgi:hypothetical protein
MIVSREDVKSFWHTILIGLDRAVARYVAREWIKRNLQVAKKPIDVGTIRRLWEEATGRYLPLSQFIPCLKSCGIPIIGEDVYCEVIRPNKKSRATPQRDVSRGC